MLSLNERTRDHQHRRLASMLEALWNSNQFYRTRLRQAGIADPRDLRSLDDLAHLPMTTKRELIQDQEANPPFGTNFTLRIEVPQAQSTGAIATVQDKLEMALKFRARAIAVPPGALAVSEFKGRRINDRRKVAKP